MRFEKLDTFTTPLNADCINPSADCWKECNCGCANAIYPLCKKCGKSHGMGIRNTMTGHIKPIDLCYDCLWKNKFTKDYKAVLQ